MGNAMGNAVMGAVGEERPVADPDPLVFWECRRCKPRLGPGNFRLKFTQQHMQRHQKDDEAAQLARDEEARQRAEAAAAAANQRNSWMGRRKKY